MHVATALYLESFDFDSPDGRARTELMIAATPRSGSTALCLELWRTGVLGSPLEYANFKLLSRIPRWSVGLNDKIAHWQKVKSVRTGPNGVFSYKFFALNYRTTAQLEPRLLDCIAPTHVIYLTRRDLLGQAISYSKACRSGHWFAGGDPLPNLAFDREHVRQKFNGIVGQMQSWERIFELTKAHPLRVTYEDFLSDTRSVVRRCMEHVLGTDVSMTPRDIPPIEIQRDINTEHWRGLMREVARDWELSDLAIRRQSARRS